MPQAKSASHSPERINDRKVRIIHVARRQLHLSEEDYRSILNLFGGVQHAAELTNGGFTAVMGRFTALGFQSTSPRRPLSQRRGMASSGQTSLIRQLWAEFTGETGTEADLGKWLERQFGVSALRFVAADLAPKVIAALKAMKVKRAKKQSDQAA